MELILSPFGKDNYIFPGIQGVHRCRTADANVNVRPQAAGVRGASVPAAAPRAARAARSHAQQPR